MNDIIEDDDGVTFDYTTPAVVPGAAPLPTLTARQLRLALLALNVFPADVAATIAQISDPTARAIAEIEWAHTTAYEREHPLVESVAAALLPNLSPADLDAVWREAASR